MNADCPIRGPYPLLVTPWTEDARLDIDILVRDGDGNLSDYPMSDAEKREVEQRMRYCGLLPEEEK